MKKVKKLISDIFTRKNEVDKLYEKNEFLKAYSKHTDIRVAKDAETSTGGLTDTIGPLQFDFLIKNNMQPHHTMLDIGCGTLRGGIFAIKHLNPGNYHGIDISSGAIDFCNKRVAEEGLTEKKPHLVLSKNMDLKFSEFSGKKFDFMMAQSVFTHLKPEHIKECFENIGKIMHENSSFYFTYREAETELQRGLKDFSYPFSMFESFAEEFGFNIIDRSSDYKHPRGQLMTEVTKK